MKDLPLLLLQGVIFMTYSLLIHMAFNKKPPAPKKPKKLGGGGNEAAAAADPAGADPGEVEESPDGEEPPVVNLGDMGERSGVLKVCINLISGSIAVWVGGGTSDSGRRQSCTHLEAWKGLLYQPFIVLFTCLTMLYAFLASRDVPHPEGLSPGANN